MEYLITALEITMALFAVIGIYSLARLLSQRLFGSKQLLLAIEIANQEDLEMAEDLIREGLGQFLLMPSGRLVILTREDLAEDPRLRQAAARFGVPILVSDRKA